MLTDIEACPCCTIKSLPLADRAALARQAVGINPSNAPAQAGRVPDVSPESITMLTGKYWGAAGAHLSVFFMEPLPAELRAKILAYANKWSAYANVSFTETNNPNAQVRVSTRYSGYWSYLGTDILGIPAGQPTINFQGFSLDTPDSEFDRVVCHEFGHTLGCPHEHERQEVIDQLDAEKVISYFGQTQGWGRQEVIDQILTPLDPASIWASASDVRSIMCYQFSGQVTKSGQPIPGGMVIDAIDGDFMGQRYPKASPPPPPVKPPVGPPTDKPTAYTFSGKLLADGVLAGTMVPVAAGNSDAAVRLNSWLSDGLDVFARLSGEAVALATKYGPDAFAVLAAARLAATERSVSSLTALYEAVTKLIADASAAPAGASASLFTDIASWLQLAEMVAAFVRHLRHPAA